MTTPDTVHPPDSTSCSATLAINPAEFAGWLPSRPADCHKGDFGSVGIIGGAPGMAGAALLAARAALLFGAGRVYAHLLDTRIAVDFTYPELMIAEPATVLGLLAPAALVVGPGLGQHDAARAILEDALASPMPLLIDADGLNLIAATDRLQAMTRARTTATLLTPHPGEAGRLLGNDKDSVQANRVDSVRRLAERYRATVILKGAGSLIHSPGEPVWRNSTGNPGLAAPGMGDVLAGLIAALLAQGLPATRAARLAVVLHGAAADHAVSSGSGPVGLTASEVARAARAALNALIR